MYFRQNEGQGRIDQDMEIEHQRYMEGKHKCEEIEKKVRKVHFNMKSKNDKTE